MTDFHKMRFAASNLVGHLQQDRLPIDDKHFTADLRAFHEFLQNHFLVLSKRRAVDNGLIELIGIADVYDPAAPRAVDGF